MTENVEKLDADEVIESLKQEIYSLKMQLLETQLQFYNAMSDNTGLRIRILNLKLPNEK